MKTFVWMFFGFYGLMNADAAPAPSPRPIETVVVRPKVIQDVLVNPGIGFTTFQRFDGDPLNPGEEWSEGFPLVRYSPAPDRVRKDHPETSIAYFRINWRFLEPEEGKFNWEIVDSALRAAHERKQTLMFRVAPHGPEANADVPDWYRAHTKEDAAKKLKVDAWRIDPENSAYAKYFGRIIRALGAKYDGHPDLELIDVAIVGHWGEGAGSDQLSDSTREVLLDAYFDSFKKTPLAIQPADPKVVSYSKSRGHIGWRSDCLGDVGGFIPTWCHMYDLYPQEIIRHGLDEAWKTGPVTMEACWVMNFWKKKKWDLQYIIDQSLKWHISSFNNKSSSVPREWKKAVDEWLKKMGYRFALRKWTYPSRVAAGQKIEFTSWWENLGVAPCYKDFKFAIRLKNLKDEIVLVTDADIRKWLPGDSLFDSSVVVPKNLPKGQYDLSVSIVDPQMQEPKIKLAIAGIDKNGWYRMGSIEIE